MNVTVESSGNLMIAYLIGELDHHSAGAVRDKIDSSISCMKPNHLILDFKNVSFMDSSGIGLVMGRYRLMQNHRGSVEIRLRKQKKLWSLRGSAELRSLTKSKAVKIKRYKYGK